MKYKVLIASVLSLALSISSPIIAQADQHSGPMSGMKNNETYKKCHEMKKKYWRAKYQKWQQELNLTDEQKEQFKAIRTEKKSMMKALRMKKRGLRIEMYKLALPKEVDQEKVNALLEKNKALTAEKFKIKFDSKHKMFNVLSDEQKQKVSDKFSKMSSDNKRGD